MHVWGAVLGVASLQSTCSPAAALVLLSAFSSRKCDSSTLHDGAVAAPRPIARRAQQHCTLVCLASRLPQHERPDPATFRKQVQLSKDLKSMRYGRWRELIPRLKQEREAGLPFDEYIFAAAIAALGSAKQFDGVMRVWQLMLRDGLKPDIPLYNALIDACSKSGHASKALECLQQMQAEGLEPNVKSYSAAIDACARCGMAVEAFELLEQMTVAGIAPNVITYNAVINACSKAGQYERAVAVLKQMRTVGLTPDELSYTSAIDACARC